MKPSQFIIDLVQQDVGDHAGGDDAQDEGAVDLAPLIATRRLAQMALAVVDTAAAVPILPIDTVAAPPLVLVAAIMAALVIYLGAIAVIRTTLRATLLQLAWRAATIVLTTAVAALFAVLFPARRVHPALCVCNTAQQAQRQGGGKNSSMSCHIDSNPGPFGQDYSGSTVRARNA
jgi:hypothetical protein